MPYIRERLDAIERQQDVMNEQLHRIESILCEVWDLLGRAVSPPRPPRP